MDRDTDRQTDGQIDRQTKIKPWYPQTPLGVR